MSFAAETARRWAISVTTKELEANIVALQHQPDGPQTISFRDGWVTVFTTADILTAAHGVLAERS